MKVKHMELLESFLQEPIRCFFFQSIDRFLIFPCQEVLRQFRMCILCYEASLFLNK